MSLLVIDVGSSSLRALLFDAGAQLIPGALVRHAHRFDDDAAADPDALRAALETCLDEILQHEAARSITMLGMTTFAANLLGVDAAGEALTPLYTYADTRSSADAAALAQEFDLGTAHARSGCRIHPAYHPAKLRWLRRTQPLLYGRVARWTDFATYCYSRWFGRDVPCSYSLASWTGLLNRAALRWDAEWLAALGLNESVLPPLADYDQVQRGLSDAYAARWPALRDVPFFLALGDGAAANIGTGGDTPQRPVLTVGTTAALRIVTPQPGPVPPGLWAYRVDARRHLIGGATSEGGNLFAWARETLRQDTADLNATLLAREPGAHGLTVLPFWAGERSPGYQAAALGTIHGLRVGSSPLDIVQALLEALALRLRLIYELLERPGTQLLAGGGALVQLPAWAQLIADALQTPLALADTPEASAQGVAWLMQPQAAAAASQPPAQIMQPRPQYAARFVEMLEQQRLLYARFYASDAPA